MHAHMHTVIPKVRDTKLQFMLWAGLSLLLFSPALALALSLSLLLLLSPSQA